MCGIAGIAPSDRAGMPDRSRLERMISVLRHRGPDGFGFHAAAGIGLAHARLSIIDLATGAQPIHNETGSVWVVLNGEIFNYVELRRELERAGHVFYTQSDTEVLVHAYEEHGLDFVRHLNGQFAIALWDGAARRLVLVRDRVGIRPLLYTESPAGLAFASEAKSLFAGGCLPARLDPVGLAESITFWGCVAPQTAFEGVRALPPGHLATYEGGRLTVRRYWDWAFPGPGGDEPADLEEATEALRELLVDAVRLQLRADVPVATYLSGGLDSSAVTAAVRRYTQTPLSTFSLVFDDAEFDERDYQREVAEHLHTAHVMRPVSRREVGEALPRAIWHIEAPVVRTAGVPLMLLADRVREAGIKVVLTGEGADEVFAGYDLFKEARIRRFWSRAPQSRARPALLSRLYGYLAHSPVAFGAVAGGFFARGLDRPDDPYFAHRPRWEMSGRALRYATEDFRRRVADATRPGALADRVPRPDARWSPLARDQYIEAHTLLSGYLLQAQGDRVAMAASVEGRYPFLDHRLVEFANRLPARWKIRGLEEKYILRRAVRDWLPDRVASRTKQPYRAPDSASCFEDGRALEHVAEALSPASLGDAGYFEPALVGRLVEKCRAGAAIGFGDNVAFMSVLTTQLLHRQFVARSW